MATSIIGSRAGNRRRRLPRVALFGFVAIIFFACNLAHDEFLTSDNFDFDYYSLLMARNDESPQRLEFIHISGTGGLNIVREASQNDITWGICHFVDSSRDIVQLSKTKSFRCPIPIEEEKNEASLVVTTSTIQHNISWHHVPPQLFSQLSDNPYEGAHLFTVVRNVYDRLLAEYYYQRMVVNGWSFAKTNRIQHLNAWFRMTLLALKKQRRTNRENRGNIQQDDHLLNFDHLLPQYDVCFDAAEEPRTQLVEHILHFESLEDDFDALMMKYGLPMRILSLRMVDISAGQRNKPLSVYDLTKQNILDIEHIYEDDFREWGYEIMSTKIPMEAFTKTALLLSSQNGLSSNDSPKKMHSASSRRIVNNKRKPSPQRLPRINPYIKDIMEKNNLTYPEGWFPKIPEDAPSLDTFVYTPGRLEFVHVPKTGGTMVESAAARHGITWAVCHFSPPQNAFAISYGETMCPGNVPIQNWGAQIHNVPWWHLPSYYFDIKDKFPANPYSTGANLFCIVRNPHERMVSEYHYAAKLSMRWSDERRNNVEAMNEWLLKRITAFSIADKGNLTQGRIGEKEYFQSQGHFIPQYEYVFDQGGNRVIQHIVKFETLHQDFAMLMKKYRINITLPAKNVRLGRKYDKKTGVKDLSPEVVKIIEDVYKADYEFFGYPKLAQDIKGAR